MTKKIIVGSFIGWIILFLPLAILGGSENTFSWILWPVVLGQWFIFDPIVFPIYLFILTFPIISSYFGYKYKSNKSYKGSILGAMAGVIIYLGVGSIFMWGL